MKTTKSHERPIVRIASVALLSIACACQIVCTAFGADTALTDATTAKTMSVSLGNGLEMEFVLIQPGSFVMGSDVFRFDVKPAHKVTITKPFYMSRFEVAQEQYEAIIGTNPSGFKGAKRPVENISWIMAIEFCKLFSKKTGTMSRLPTEAEWEYACRAGTTTKYCFGDFTKELPDYAWLKENSGGTTHDVGQKKPNAWGLYDMHGNTWEWCQDWYDSGYYTNSPFNDPQGPDTGKWRVHRGGSWYENDSTSRSAIRARIKPHLSDTHYGLRLCLQP